MGYSKSIRAVKRVQPILEQLVEASTKIEWGSDNPAQDAYYIREGIHASAHRAMIGGKPNEPYYSFARLHSKFILKTGAGKVIAELRDAVPVLALKESHSVMTLPELKDEMAVVGAAITHQAQKMHFPDVDPAEADLEAIYNWASQNDYYLVAGEGLTLTRDDPGVLAWQPQ
jgi:hypothetical protein